MPTETPSTRPASGESVPEAVLRTVLVCDLVDSTALVERLGDRRAFELFRRHDRLARELLSRHRGIEIDKTDGFLLLFERPVHAVSFALGYQSALRELGAEVGQPLAARVGIHLGEVFLRRNAREDVERGAKPVEVEGLAKPVAARLAALALPGQTLLTRAAFDLARRATQEVLPEGLRWRDHGQYALKGVEEPVRVYEVGIEGEAPLARPPAAGGAPAPPDEQPRRRTPLVVAAVALALAALIAALWWSRRAPAPPAPGEREAMVLADVVNHTEEPLLAEALDLAVRVGFEQSGHVRVLPASRVRSALARMERPDGARLDRELAIEVAQREGASAVVVTTVAEVGRRFTLTGEVVDPATGATRLVETAEADSHEEIVAALGQVIDGLRGRLGEALPEAAERKPLPTVTTADLEGLKAFALGVEKADRMETQDAVALLERAIESDPDFASAHAKLGTVYFYQLGDAAAAERHWSEALARADRLPDKERLYVEGSRAWQGEPEEMVRIWTLMANLHPDDPQGGANLGYALWYYFNDFAAASRGFTQSLRYATGAFIIRTHHSLGYTQIGQEAPGEAIVTFERAWELAEEPVAGGQADAYLAAGRAADAHAFLEQTATYQRPGFPVYPFERTMRLALLAIDAGRLDEAREALRQGERIATQHPHYGLGERAAVGTIAVLEATGDPSLEASLTKAIDELEARLAEPSGSLTNRPISKLCLLGKVAARNGWDHLAARVEAAARPQVESHDVAHWQAHLAMLRAEIALAGGHAREARSAIEAAPARPELFQLHETGLRVAVALGDRTAAAREAEWLASHRGWAIAEWNDWFYGRELNLLAHLAGERWLRETASGG